MGGNPLPLEGPSTMNSPLATGPLSPSAGDPQPVVFTYSERDVEKAVNSATGWTKECYSEVHRLIQ